MPGRVREVHDKAPFPTFFLGHYTQGADVHPMKRGCGKRASRMTRSTLSRQVVGNGLRVLEGRV